MAAVTSFELDLRPWPNVELFMRRTKLDEFSSWMCMTYFFVTNKDIHRVLLTGYSWLRMVSYGYTIRFYSVSYIPDVVFFFLFLFLHESDILFFFRRFEISNIRITTELATDSQLLNLNYFFLQFSKALKHEILKYFLSTSYSVKCKKKEKGKQWEKKW